MSTLTFKVGATTFTLTPLTKRKTCPVCNGKGWVKYPDTGEKDACEICDGLAGTFIQSVMACLDDSSLNHLYLEKYFSKDDFQKFELAQKLSNEMDRNYELTNSNAYENTPHWIKMQEGVNHEDNKKHN